jgi:hypothetical protein
MSMLILQWLIRAYAQWEAQSFPQLTHRGGIPAVVIEAVWGNGMQSELPEVIRDAADVMTAYELGLSSRPSCPCGQKTSRSRRTVRKCI